MNKITLMLLLTILFCTIYCIERYKPKKKTQPQQLQQQKKITNNKSNNEDCLLESHTNYCLNKYYFGCPLKEGGYFYAHPVFFWWQTIASEAYYECNIRDKLVTKSMIVKMFYEITGERFTKDMFTAINNDSKMSEEQKQRIRELFKPLDMTLKVGKELVLRYDNGQLSIKYDNVQISTLKEEKQ